MIAWLLTVALADEPVILDVFEQWADKAAAELQLDGVRPGRVVIAAQDRRRFSVTAEMGTLYNESEEQSRPGLVEVVVGDDQRDSSRFTTRGQASQAARAHPQFVVEDVPLALARDLWLTTDDSFKDALSRYPQKVAALAQLATPYPPDWTPAEPVSHVVPHEPAPVDREALRRLAVQGSAAFRTVPGLRNGWVEITVEQGDFVMADSEGMRIVQPEDRVVLFAWCDTVRPDGVQVYDEMTLVLSSPDELPTAEVLVPRLTAMAERTAARAGARIVDAYEGPVLFEGEAAAMLLAGLLTPELEGTPPEPRAGSTYEQLTRGGPRVGRRLLPDGWTVTDDPTQLPPGSPVRYDHDREGVAAAPVELVRDGRVVDLLMSRVPRAELSRSNGHARGPIHGTWEARVASLSVTADRPLADAALDRLADRTARSAGVEALLVVRSMQRGRPGSLSRPMDAVWRYPDGHEEPVVALQFQYANRRLLKDILGASRLTVLRVWMASGAKGGADATSLGLPTSIRAPARLLVDDMEATFPGSDRKPDAYPMPVLGALDR